MSQRWPAHPPPFPGEALTSWLRRLADALGLPAQLLLEQEFGIRPKSASRYGLDFDPPEHLVCGLAEKTGQSIDTVRRLTARGHVPVLFDGLERSRFGVNSYTNRFNLLLPLEYRKPRRGVVLPWYSLPRFRKPRGCRICLSRDKVPYFRLHWRFSWIISCPRHKRELEPFATIGPVIRTSAPIWKETSPRKIPAELLAMDTTTWQAVHYPMCDLPCGRVMSGYWVRLLRTLLEELSTGAYDTHQYRRIMQDHWKSMGVGYRVNVLQWTAYESMNYYRQSIFMYAAAKTLDIVLKQNAGPQIMEMAESYAHAHAKTLSVSERI